MKLSTQVRQDGERRAQLVLVRLLCTLSIWRTAMTRLLPLCGASAWWVLLLCLLPGLGTAALLAMLMRLTKTNTLAECIRVCLGSAGVMIMSAMLAVLLLTEGISSMTALTTLFTQGIGTRGTQLTLAILTGAVLLFSMHREGLPRAIYFLRWGMLAAVLLTAAFLLAEAKIDRLFPLWGEGRATVFEAVRTGLSLGWPIVLILTVEPSGTSRLESSILPGFGAVAAVLLVILVIPHDLLMQSAGLARSLLLSVRFVPNVVRVVAQSLMMLAFFLSIGASVQLASNSICIPLLRRPSWLPYALTGVLIFSQAADVSALWAGIEAFSVWMLAPLLLLTLLCLPIALFRRKP